MGFLSSQQKIATYAKVRAWMLEDFVSLSHKTTDEDLGQHTFQRRVALIEFVAEPDRVIIQKITTFM